MPGLISYLNELGLDVLLIRRQFTEHDLMDPLSLDNVMCYGKKQDGNWCIMTYLVERRANCFAIEIVFS